LQDASEYLARRKVNEALKDQATLEGELKQFKLDNLGEHYAAINQRLLYENAPIGADNLDEISARLSKQAELVKGMDDVKFGGSLELWRQDFDAKLGDFDAKAKDTRELAAQKALYAAQTTLAQRKLEINGPITELAKEEAAWTARIEVMKLNGLAVSEKEVQLRDGCAVATRAIYETRPCKVRKLPWIDASPSLFDPLAHLRCRCDRPARNSRLPAMWPHSWPSFLPCANRGALAFGCA
jgi:hypothetical protein